MYVFLLGFVFIFGVYIITIPDCLDCVGEINAFGNWRSVFKELSGIGPYILTATVGFINSISEQIVMKSFKVCVDADSSEDASVLFHWAVWNFVSVSSMQDLRVSRNPGDSLSDVVDSIHL